MTDPFTSLRRTDDRAELDPAFRAELLTLVRRRLADDSPITVDRTDRPSILLEVEDTPVARRRRPQWFLVVAAAAVAVIVAGTLVLVSRTERSERIPAGAPTTVDPTTAAAVEVAREFLDAYAANDADRALTYLSDSAIATRWGSAEQFRAEIAWNVAAGFKLIINDCERHDNGAEAGISVRCGFDHHGFGSDAIGFGPFGDNYWDLTVRDGEIASASWTLADATNGFSEEIGEPFAEWIAAAYPDDVLVMYTGTDQEQGRHSEEAVGLWEQRTEEYASGPAYARLSPSDNRWPPEAATPSAPAHGELVDAYNVDFDGGLMRVQLYADGRLIWVLFANDFATGWLEQRLTREGVELMRTLSNVQEKDPRRLHEWLPDRAWEQRRPIAYVPSSYAVCLHLVPADRSLPTESPPSIEELVALLPPIEELVALLPAPAADLLGRSADTVHDENYRQPQECPVVTTEDARLLNGMLNIAGTDELSFVYVTDEFNEMDAELSVEFVPVLPDGSSGRTGGSG